MKKSLENRLKRLNIAIISLIFATGPALDLEEFLKDKVNNLVFIGHPFSFSKTPASFLRIYSKKKLVAKQEFIKLRIPDILLYIKDAFLTFWWFFRYPEKIDLYIGSDGFMTFLGLFLKQIGKVKDVVLYTIDFMPRRFPNVALNWLYHYFDEQALKNCKVVWNLSDKMAQGREEYMRIKRENLVPQLTVPLGIWNKRIPKLQLNKKRRHQLVFMGHILEKQGLDIVIEAMPIISKKMPKVQLIVIGTGQYEDNLKRKVKKLKIEKFVKFLGYIESHIEVEKLLSESIVAVATYKPDPESFTYFADPGKIKNYLAAGLPVILTDVPPIARDIEEKKCGFIVKYDYQDLAITVIRLLSSPVSLKRYSQNAFKYAKNFDWDYIFPKALKETIE